MLEHLRDGPFNVFIIILILFIYLIVSDSNSSFTGTGIMYNLYMKRHLFKVCEKSLQCKIYVTFFYVFIHES